MGERVAVAKGIAYPGCQGEASDRVVGVERVAGQEDSAFATCGGEALVIDIGLGAGDGELPVASVGGVDENLDSLVGEGYVAFLVGWEVWVFYVGNKPLRRCGPIGVAFCDIASVGYGCPVDGINDEV